MRDFKFRAWLIKDKGFIAGFNMFNYHSYFNKGLKKSLCRYNSEWEEDEYTLGRYTELKDKTGREIYEDDFCKCYTSDDNLLVSFWRGQWVLVHKPTCQGETEDETRFDILFDVASSDIKIVGNRFQNPELL